MKAIARTITTAIITVYTPEGEKVYTVPGCDNEKEAKRYCKRNDLYFLRAIFEQNLYKMSLDDFLTYATMANTEETVEDE